jgi:hypothetical protein
MSHDGSQDERQRLARAYAAMPDVQLEDLASVAFSLTSIALDALKDEISRRGLNVVVVENASDDGPLPRLVTIRRFRDLPDALLAKSVLESAQIECFLADEVVIRMDWLWSYALGQIKLHVRDAHASSADEVLKASAAPLERFDVPGVGEYEQPRCPNCKSLNLCHDPLTRAAYASFLSSLFIAFFLLLLWPVRRFGWNCRDCGCWAEEDDAAGV